jgi:hypothetical protein
MTGTMIGDNTAIVMQYQKFLPLYVLSEWARLIPAQRPQYQRGRSQAKTRRPKTKEILVIMTKISFSLALNIYFRSF